MKFAAQSLSDIRRVVFSMGDFIAVFVLQDVD